MKLSTRSLASIYTGRLFDVNMKCVYVGLERLTEQTVYTHDLGRLAKAVRPYLRERFPWLEDVAAWETNEESIYEHIARLEDEYGLEVDVTPIPSGRILEMNPIESLKFAGVDESFGANL